LLDADGHVVAVNGSDAPIAVAGTLARTVVQELLDGTQQPTIGVSGQARLGPGGAGVWVRSVQPGSPAAAAGVEAGDVLTSVGSVPLATDETLGSFCDVVSDNVPTGPLAVEVYRPELDQRLVGAFNGSVLRVVTSLGVEYDELVADAGGFSYAEYTTISDDSNLISLAVPTEWVDTDGRQWSSDLATGTSELIGPALSASTDIGLFHDTWGTPGIFVSASAMIPLGVEEALDRYDFSEACAFTERNVFDNGRYTGVYDVYTNCGPEGSTFFEMLFEPPDQTWMGHVQFVALTVADLVAADAAISSVTVQPLAGM
jgi:serine protease Do